MEFLRITTFLPLFGMFPVLAMEMPKSNNNAIHVIEVLVEKIATQQQSPASIQEGDESTMSDNDANTPNLHRATPSITLNILDENSNAKSGYNKGKKYNCDICNYETNSFISLGRHKKTHNEEKHCDVPGCTVVCYTKYGLTKHQNSCHQELQYACDYPDCPYSGSIRAVSDHKKTHHEKNYYCDYEGCEFSTASKTGLTLHQNRRHKEKKYHCNQQGCEYSTSTESALSAHKAQKHNIFK